MSTCCCGGGCYAPFAGSKNPLSQSWFNEGFRRNMCIRACVKDWEYIWSWDKFLAAFETDSASGVDKIDKLFPAAYPPYPITIPDYNYPPVKKIPSGTIYSMGGNSGCTPLHNEPAPVTSHDAVELPVGEGEEVCWDLRCEGQLGIRNEAEVSYRAGYIEDPDQGNAIYSISILYQAQLYIRDAWENNDTTMFGRIIREGDRVGWFEKPLLMKTLIMSTHRRWRRSYYFTPCTEKDVDEGRCNDRPPPEWPDGWLEEDPKAAQKYTSNAQDIEYYVKVRTKNLE